MLLNLFKKYIENYKTVMKEIKEDTEDGGGIGRGDHFLFYKFIERTTER